MRVEVVMPQMGESIVEGTVVNWHKQAGDRVKRDEDIFTISTDKVDADIPSPAEGVLEEILVAVGDTVEVGTTVALIETEPETTAAAPTKRSPAPRKERAEPEDQERESRDARGGGGDAAGSSAGSSDVEELRRNRSTPLVRKIAREHGIQDLSIIPGSGVSGRVTKRDILDYIDRAEEHEAAAVQDLAQRPVEADSRVTIVADPQPTVVREERIVTTAPKIHLWDDDRVEPMSRMRKSIADHMVMSRHVSAHVQAVWECDWSRAVSFRKGAKAEFEARGIKLTYTAILIQAAVEALRAFPIVNTSVDGDRIIYRNRINIGMAVALSDGLIVPVIKRADELSLLGIARAVNDLSERARDKKLKPEDVEGGTFTITNPGVFGSLYGIPIINQPQVAILGVGAIKRRVVVDEGDAIRIADMNTMCLSFDHRVVDGAVADQFMRTFVGFIEGYDSSRTD